MATGRRPIISVAIATRNYGRYLGRALDSIFRCHNPTGAPIQVVVADDASTDNTRVVLAEYHRRYPESLAPILMRSAVGIGAAKQAALDQCRGHTVATLDADDEFLPEKLVRCHAALASGGVDIVTNDFYLKDGAGKTELKNSQTWSDWYWPPSTWVFRNGLVQFHRLCLGAEDVEWMERRWWSLRRRHLDLPLNVQHFHGQNHQKEWPSRITGLQAIGGLLGRPDPNDALTPPVWACRICGNQYLLPHRCCGRAAVERPAYFYLPALSPHYPTGVEFSLVMLTRNGLALTRRAIGSIVERIPAGHRRAVELIFVDGCSTDGTTDYIRGLAQSHPVKLMVTHPRERFNYARACNRGARVAVGKYLLLLNNDIELRSSNPWEPLRAAFEDPRVGVVGVSTWWGAEQQDPEWTAGSPAYLLVNRPLTGDFWGARREVFWELGGVDESFAGYGYDELDFEFRAQLAHYHMALARVKVHHEYHKTFNRVYGGAVVAGMELENRVRFARKHGRAIYKSGPRVEPFSSHVPPPVSVVVTVRDEGARLRDTLALAARDRACRDGRVQVVVVDNGSNDETALLLEQYRHILPHCLTVVTLPEAVGPARARQIGEARAIGRTVRVLAPGDWQEATASNAAGAEP